MQEERTSENLKKKSTFGTNSTDLTNNLQKILDTKSLKQFILLCGRAGVSELKFGDFHIVYHSPTDIGQPVVTKRQVPKSSKVVTLEETVDEELLKDLERAQKITLDPVGFEEQEIDALLGQDVAKGK